MLYYINPFYVSLIVFLWIPVSCTYLQFFVAAAAARSSQCLHCVCVCVSVVPASSMLATNAKTKAQGRFAAGIADSRTRAGDG